MSSSNLVRWGALGALLAGVAWMVSFIVGLAVRGQGVGAFGTPSSPLDEALYVIALLGTLVGVVGIHALQARIYGWLGTTGFLAAFVGTGLALVGFVLTFLVRGEVLRQELLDQILGLGLLGMLVGLVVLGVGFVLLGAATLRARVLPIWCAVALIVALPVSIALGAYAGLWLGLVLLALGYALWSRRGATATR